MQRPPTLLAAILLATTPGLQAQSAVGYPVRDCDARAQPVGPIRATGRVAFLLGSDGRADTSSLRVLEVEAMSVAGFRSAIGRKLATCRFRMPDGRSKEAVPVEQAIAASGVTFELSPAGALDSLPTGEEPGVVLIPTQDLPLEPSDRRIEESPMPLRGCRPTSSSVRGGIYRSLAEAQRDIQGQLEAVRGSLRVDLEVDRDGRVVEGSIEVIREDNPTATAAFLKDLRKCRFTPARIGGMPVPFKMTLGMETNRRQP